MGRSVVPVSAPTVMFFGYRMTERASTGATPLRSSPVMQALP